MGKLLTVTAAIVFLSGVPCGQPFHLLGAPGSQLSTECLAKNVEDAEAGGYLRSIKPLGSGDATLQAPVVSMVLLPTGRRPLNGAAERLLESAELVKDRVVLMFFEQSADGEPSLDARVAERFEEAGAAGIIVLNSAAERGSRPCRFTSPTRSLRGSSLTITLLWARAGRSSGMAWILRSDPTTSPSRTPRASSL